MKRSSGIRSKKESLDLHCFLLLFPFLSQDLHYMTLCPLLTLLLNQYLLESQKTWKELNTGIENSKDAISGHLGLWGHSKDTECCLRMRSCQKSRDKKSASRDLYFKWDTRSFRLWMPREILRLLMRLLQLLQKRWCWPEWSVWRQRDCNKKV